MQCMRETEVTFQSVLAFLLYQHMKGVSAIKMYMNAPFMNILKFKENCDILFGDWRVCVLITGLCNWKLINIISLRRWHIQSVKFTELFNCFKQLIELCINKLECCCPTDPLFKKMEGTSFSRFVEICVLCSNRAYGLLKWSWDLGYIVGG